MKSRKDIPPDLQLVINENIFTTEELARVEVLYHQGSSSSFMLPVYESTGKRSWKATPHPCFKARNLTSEVVGVAEGGVVGGEGMLVVVVYYFIIIVV